MLQQTTVKTVIPYFDRFLDAFPTVHDLANAKDDDVMHLWQGLGYYSRARNLKKCAIEISKKGGTFPQTEKELLDLPGIGPYTAAAIASIAFDQKATVMDGNVERVVSRLFKIEQPLPTYKKHFKEKAELLTPDSDNAAYSNAIMEHGATICTPKKPKCNICPVSIYCAVFKESLNPADFPQKEPKKKKSVDHGTVYLIENTCGELYLQKRPDKGLLGGLWEFPSTGWAGESTSKPSHFEEVQEQAEPLGQIRHIFTHIDLTLDVMYFKGDVQGSTYTANSLPPLSTLMQKVLKLK
jgi:A/G-specific adenine glycosylase